MKILLAAVLFVLSCQLVQGQSFPEVNSFFAPTYPPAAQAVGAQGDVEVAVAVDSNGKVVSASAVTGHPLLRRAAEFATQKWAFTANKGNHFITLKFLFRLSDHDAKTTTKLLGSYTLRFTAARVRILQTRTHSSPASA